MIWRKKMTGGFKEQQKIIDDLAGRTAGGFKEQQKIIDGLTERMTEGFKRQEKITDEKIDDLAAMTKLGFDGAAKKLGSRERRFGSGKTGSCICKT